MLRRLCADLGRRLTLSFSGDRGLSRTRGWARTQTTAHPARRLFLSACAVMVPVVAAQSPQNDLDQLLTRIGSYVERYQRSFSVVVAREQYRQEAIVGGRRATRALVSEVALVALGDRDWLLFRDVCEVDGRAVRDRRDRLAALFLNPAPDLASQAKRIVDEGARYNIGTIVRTFNTPTQALEFVRPANQARSRFSLGGRRGIRSFETREIRFAEQASPRLIFTRDDAPATGRVWVNPEDGAILRTELRITSVGVAAMLTVEYEFNDRLALWVPTTLTESYESTARTGSGRLEFEQLPSSRVDGRATYSDFRRFAVDTSTIFIR